MIKINTIMNINISNINTYKINDTEYLRGYNKIICWAVIIISLYFAVIGAISMLRFTFRFIKVDTFMITTNIIPYIIGIIISVIVMYGLLNVYTFVNTSIFDVNADKYMFVAPPNIETFDGTCTNPDTNIGGCATSTYGCCPDGQTAKLSSSDTCIRTTTGSSTQSSGKPDIPLDIPPDSYDFNGGEAGTEEAGTEEAGTEESLGVTVDPYDCSQTVYGCCPNNSEAKLDAEGTNCDDISGNIPSWAMMIVLCLVIAVLFIFIGVSNKFLKGVARKIIVFILFLMLVSTYLYTLHNAFYYANNITNSVSLERDTNSCYNIKYVVSGSSLATQYAWIICATIVFIGLYLFASKKALDGSGGGLLSFTLPLLTLGFTSIFAMGLYLWYKYPTVLLGLIFVSRLVFVFIANLFYRFGYGKKNHGVQQVL